MTTTIDGVLVQWGDRLFYPPSRTSKATPLPRLDALTGRRAAAIRARIAATVTRRAPQVMVKVTGGGRGMGAIAAHFRYISKNGRLELEDDRGFKRDGQGALHELVEQWRYGGSLIGEVSHRREAFNIMLSMPAGTRPEFVRQAAREFAKVELRGHRWVMVLHDHQANPHVHLSVRGESMTGERLNPRKADLHRWRETFAEKLRGLGIDAEATRQATRGENRNYEALWRLKAKEEGRLQVSRPIAKSGARHLTSRNDAAVAWAHIMKALAASDVTSDRQLAEDIKKFLIQSPHMKKIFQFRQRQVAPTARHAIERTPQPAVTKRRPDPEMER
jgi:hypothetical protein